MNRLFGREVSRRKLLGSAVGGAAVFGMSGSAVLGRGSAASGGPFLHLNQQVANIPTPREQTVVIQAGQTDIFDTFNPYIPNGEMISWGIHQLAREPLFINNLMTGEMVPWLATGYNYNPDFTEMTITLQPNATWSDGTPFTSDDILFTFEMLAANENLYGAGTATQPASITAPDQNTVVFTMPEPDPRWHLNFVADTWSQWIRIVPKHIWEGQDPNTFAFNPPVYTGPYTLIEANPQTLMYVWQKNPNYWNSALQFAPEYVIYMQELPLDARIQEFQRGGVDAAGIDFLNQQVIMASYDQAVLCEYPDPCPRAFQPNHLSPLFQYPEARWALSLLTNREIIATTIMQPPTVPASYPWPNYGSNDMYEIPELAQQYDLTEFNPERAGQLLDSIGATRDGDWRTLNGQPLELSMVTPVPAGAAEFQIAQLVAQEAQNIGLNLQLINLQGATYNDALQLGNYDVQSGWTCVGAPPGLYGNFAVTEDEDPVAPIGTRTEFNVERINIEELVPIVEQLSTVGSDDVQNPLYRQALEIYFRELPVIPTVQTRFSYIMNTMYWTGWPTNEEPFAPPKYDLQSFIIALSSLRPAGSA